MPGTVFTPHVSAPLRRPLPFARTPTVAGRVAGDWATVAATAGRARVAHFCPAPQLGSSLGAVTRCLRGSMAVGRRLARALCGRIRRALHEGMWPGRFRRIAHANGEATVVLDGDLEVRWQSPAVTDEFALSNLAGARRHFLSVLHPHDALVALGRLRRLVDHAARNPAINPQSELIETRLRDGRGRWRDVELAVRVAPRAGWLVVGLRDVRQRRRGSQRFTTAVRGADPLAAARHDEALRRAEAALHHVATTGPPSTWSPTNGLDGDPDQQIVMRRDLPGALVRGELDLLYQPIMDLGLDYPYAVEATLCWMHPTLGRLTLTQLAPVAARLGLIDEISSWSVDHASRQLAQWLAAGRDLVLSLNVGWHQLAGLDAGGGGLCADIDEAIIAYGLPANRLVIELDQRPGAVDTDVVEACLRQVRARGVRTALDDFAVVGSGALDLLRILPVDVVKIGRSPLRPPDLEVIEVMVGLGRQLAFDVVAQGLETWADRRLVQATGCHLGQGPLFAEPAAAEVIESYLDGFFCAD